MRFDDRYDLSTFTITLEPEEVNQDADILELPDDFRAKAAEFLEARRKKQEEEAGETRLAEEAAAACPIKVGQEVRDPEAWRNRGSWWRVRSIGGSPGRPWLHCDLVRADGSTGQRDETFYEIARLEVRENTAGRRRDKAIPLKNLAAQVDGALRAIPKTALPERWQHPCASVSGSRILIRYSWNRSDKVVRDEAQDYLDALQEGFIGTIRDLSDYRRERRGAAAVAEAEEA